MEEAPPRLLGSQVPALPTTMEEFGALPMEEVPPRLLGSQGPALPSSKEEVPSMLGAEVPAVEDVPVPGAVSLRKNEDLETPEKIPHLPTGQHAISRRVKDWCMHVAFNHPEF